MASKKKESIDFEQSQDNDSMQERLKKLEDENYWLRLDNAILKEARRLRLEEEAKLNEKALIVLEPYRTSLSSKTYYFELVCQNQRICTGKAGFYIP